MAIQEKSKETQAHCNVCSGNRTHEVHFSKKTSWDEQGMAGGTTYELVKCCGCGSFKLRLVQWDSEDLDEDGFPLSKISYYPPAIFRPKPRWLVDLFLKVALTEGESIYELLAEVYVALQNDQRTLAAMGVRALLENVMIDKCGEDSGSFFENVRAFEAKGYVSRIQRERLETILEAGHAAIHRLYKPTNEDLITLMDIAESLIESIYIHGERVDRLKTSIPPRKPRKQ